MSLQRSYRLRRRGRVGSRARNPSPMIRRDRRGKSGRPFRLSFCMLICLSLSGCKKKPHSVTLNWQAPPPVRGVSIVNYNLYRSTTSGKGFVLLASKIPGPPYEDRLVQSGRTYFYVVTAVDRLGRESGFSAEARAT